jgi:hypothetical protein
MIEMNVFTFILAFAVLAPIARGIGVRLAFHKKPDQPDPQLETTLRATEQRLAETESRLAAVEEKLDFYEKLLANTERRNLNA